MSLAHLAVASRREDGAGMFERPEVLPREALDRLVRVPMEAIEISGSRIRERVRRRRSIRYLVPEPVRLYIEDHGLYRE